MINTVEEIETNLESTKRKQVYIEIDIVIDSTTETGTYKKSCECCEHNTIRWGNVLQSSITDG